MSLSYGKLFLRYSSVLFEKWGTTSFQTTTLNRTLEYLRHNFPWDRLISRQTDSPWSSYSQDLNPSDHFLRGYLKDRVVKTIHSQESTSSEKKSDGLHKKCWIELWTILLFQLLLNHYWFYSGLHQKNSINFQYLWRKNIEDFLIFIEVIAKEK